MEGAIASLTLVQQSKWEAADKVYILDTYVGPLLGIEVDNIQSKDFVARPPSPISPSTDVAAEFVAAPADLADPKVTKIAPTDGILDSPKTETENGQRRTTERVVEAI